jgi:hypothetical protein
MDTLGIKSKMSSPIDPQTDGQTERIDKTLECYLRYYCICGQNNWEDMLPMAEYAYNSSLHSTLQMTRFLVNCGYHPRTHSPNAEPMSFLTSQNYIQWMTSIHQPCYQRLKQGNETMTMYQDRQGKPTPEYQPSDLVILDAKNLKTRRSARPWRAKLHGLFKVMKITSSTALKLELTSRW